MTTGRLLLAVPGMLDAHFDATVVFLFDDADGAAGVVLNRPTDIPVDAVLPDWASRAAPPAVVFWGGPVQEEHAVALGTPSSAAAETVAPGVAVIDLQRDPPEGDGAVRVFAGYAGWDEGQLEEEIADGGWFAVPADAEDVVTAEPIGLWRAVFGRQRGPLRRYRTFPDDPGLN